MRDNIRRSLNRYLRSPPHMRRRESCICDGNGNKLRLNCLVCCLLSLLVFSLRRRNARRSLALVLWFLEILSSAMCPPQRHSIGLYTMPTSLPCHGRARTTKVSKTSSNQALTISTAYLLPIYPCFPSTINRQVATSSHRLRRDALASRVSS